MKTVNRTPYSKLIDVMIYVALTTMIMITLSFFANINHERISPISIIISGMVSLIVSGFLMAKYFSRYPIEIIIDGGNITINRALSKDTIAIGEIDSVHKISIASQLTGSVSYMITYSNKTICLNSKKYKNVDDLIASFNESGIAIK